MRALAHPEFHRPGGVTLLACDGCRWPVDRRDDTTFLCDDPRDLPGAYCAKHRAVAYRPAPLSEIEL